MKEQLISFETAKLAKEKEFNEKYSDFYIDKRVNGDLTDLPCVPQSLLQKWLREKHKINIYCIPQFNQIGWMIKVKEASTAYELKLAYSEFGNTYEEALEAGLLFALNLIKDEGV